MRLRVESASSAQVNKKAVAKKLLLVSYLFPPAGGISVQRMLSLAKYLPQWGFEVHVLAAWNPTTPTIDRHLLRQIPSTVRVHRTFTPEVPFNVKRRMWGWLSSARPKPSGRPAPPCVNGSSRSWKSNVVDAARKLFSPDPEVVWVPFALRRARSILRREHIDAVVVTAPPFSAFLIGNALRREFPHIRLISDFRDDWLRFFLGTFDFQKSAAVKRRAEQIERETVERSDRVVLVTRALQGEMRARYPDQPAEKFLCVPNGYDPAVFENFRPRRHSGAGIVVTYTGTVYSTTSARYYLDALDSLPEPIRSKVETRFVGRIAQEERPFLENRKSKITEYGFVPHAEALRVMEESDFLLVTMLDPTATSGKIYEYLPAGKPILAVGVEGELTQLIRETRTGWCLDPTRPMDLALALRRILDPSCGALDNFRPNWDAIRSYERPRLSGLFANIISERALVRQS
jgi:Glycosyltransferase Family 4/Glycosyl transferases group 1